MNLRRNGTGDLGHDAWEYLPQKFVLLYSELVRKSLASPSSSLSGMGERRGGEPQGPLKDEKALKVKRLIDQSLRRLVSEADADLIGDKGNRPKCEGCARFVQNAWLFCGWCGQERGKHPNIPVIPSWRGLPLK